MLGELPQPAPDFALKDYAGRNVRLSELRGEVVLVNFWATWCKTCVVEMPSMEKLAQRMKTRGKPFRLLAVSVDDGWPEVRQFFPNGTDLQVLLDTTREIPKKYGTDKFPESFLVDKDGNIRYYVISDRDWSRPEVGACIESLLNSRATFKNERRFSPRTAIDFPREGRMGRPTGKHPVVRSTTGRHRAITGTQRAVSLKRTVLVIDDSPEIARLVGKILGKSYQILVAGDGEEGLARVATELPDLVLLDLNLPKLSGWQVCRPPQGRPQARGAFRS